MNCSITDCENVALARTWCRKHYTRWHKYGRLERVNSKHGRNNSDPTYLSWVSMKWRCNKRNKLKRNRYYDRGILVCDRWKFFENFLEDMGERPEGTTLDRIDNNGNYEPRNCKWSTATEQSRNSTSSRLVIYKGETLNIKELTDKYNLDYMLVVKRLWRGWTIEQAVELPSGTRLVDVT